jgi:hypothetical protein
MEYLSIFAERSYAMLSSRRLIYLCFVGCLVFFKDMMVPIFFGPQALGHLGSGDSKNKKEGSSYF